MEPKLLNIAELAIALSVDKKTIQRLMQTNEVPFLRLGARTVRFDLDEVLSALKAKQRVNAA